MRPNDWPQRLDALLRQRSSQPFAWGTNDCVTFAADVVLAVSGSDPLGALRGQWASALEAERALASHGGLRAAVCSVLGEPIGPKFATEGDVLLIENEGRQMLAMCNGDTVIAPGPTGLAVEPCPAILAAWRAD